MLKISYAGCLGLSSAISVQVNLIMCVAAQIAKNLLKPLLGGLRSLRVIDHDTSKKLVTSARYDKQHVRAYLQLFSCYTSRYQ